MEFTITIRLAFYNKYGLNAIDFCRQFDLEPRVKVAPNPYQCSIEASCPVNEAFARCWFDRNSTEAYATISTDMLMPGELVFDGEYIELSQLSPERIKELFIAARFNSLKKEKDNASAE